MSKDLTPIENYQEQSDNTKTPPKLEIHNDRQRTAIWSNDSHSIVHEGVVKPMYNVRVPGLFTNRKTV